MRLVFSTLLATATLLTSACSQGGAPSSVAGIPRADIEAIIAEYLVSNPEALEAGLRALEAKQKTQLFDTLIASDDDPTLGPADAPITIVEFFDYNCGYCRQANDWVFDQLDSRAGDIRVVFKEYPILAESSLRASQAAHAAERQGKYREMHVAMMKSPDLSDEGIAKIAKSVGLDMEKFLKDKEDPKILEHIERVYAEASQAGVEGTPGFYVNGQFLNGFRAETLERMLKDARKAI